ncbi:MAG: hypothetical protein BM485_03465 [Desulfobulbaceae bacterium DB1]|nr:MAG: hypothetical protein BM485_03465 [Desulfobulbaceae bacterium DB1]
MGKMKQRIIEFVVLLHLCGCASLVVGSVVEPTVENLQRQTDLDLVCEGAPAYLLMVDSLVADDPANSGLVLTATRAYGSYAAALEACGRKERARTVSRRAKEYGLSLLNECGIGGSLDSGSPGDLQTALASCRKGQVPALFWGGFGWATWLQRQEGDPASLAAMVKLEQIMLRVVALDEGYYHGGPHLFLAAYYGSRPKMLGGDPEASLRHFERALALSARSLLAVQVAYAETYARTMFDRDLYERLLREVLDFPLESRPDLALANVIAKKRASELLAEADLYF